VVGRKPLVLVRAAILGCLMPASDNPRRDMEIFLNIMTMDDIGLWERSDKAALDKLVRREESGYTTKEYRELDVDEKNKLRKTVFNKWGYDKKLDICLRPEQFVRPVGDHAWNEINHHLGTHAHTLQDLSRQLAQKRFGGNSVIGDCFCGGGSVPL
jgi:adenine-specific DNA methylase